jgi:hypothetical protein
LGQKRRSEDRSTPSGLSREADNRTARSSLAFGPEAETIDKPSSRQNRPSQAFKLTIGEAAAVVSAGQVMNVRTKTIIVTYLTIWTTTVAYLTVVTMRSLYPGPVQVFIGALGLLPALAPIIAFFLAFGQAMSVTRKRNAIDQWMLPATSSEPPSASF